MTPRTVTRTIETDLEPGAILQILADARHIPEWAPVFADRVEAESPNEWRVTKDGSTFNLQVAISQSARTVDYLRKMSGGERGGAYCRVFPRPGGGSVTVMTVPIAPGLQAENVATVLEQELRALADLSAAQKRRGDL